MSALLIEKGHALPENAAISEDTVILESQDTRRLWHFWPQRGSAIRLSICRLSDYGTRGKTTSTYMVKSILENAGYKVGLIGTIRSIMGDKNCLRTDDAGVLCCQEYLHDMIACGCDCAVMEVSSRL